MNVWAILKADLYRYKASITFGAFVSAWLKEPGFRFTWYLRKTTYYSSRKRSVFIIAYLYNRMMFEHYRIRYGLDVSPSTKIGPGLYFGHFGGVVVSPFAVLGSNINVNKGAVIGATSRGVKVGAPTLEDRVWVGSNAIIVGPVTIGTESLIAPGAYVNFDVPRGVVVLGNPGKIVSNAGSGGYINNVLG